MEMTDFKELTANKERAAYDLLGFAMGLVDDIRDGLKPDAKLWRAYDEKVMAYECASRDLDECLTTEAMRQSFKD